MRASSTESSVQRTEEETEPSQRTPVLSAVRQAARVYCCLQIKSPDRQLAGPAKNRARRGNAAEVRTRPITTRHHEKLTASRIFLLSEREREREKRGQPDSVLRLMEEEKNSRSRSRSRSYKFVIFRRAAFPFQGKFSIGRTETEGPKNRRGEGFQGSADEIGKRKRRSPFHSKSLVPECDYIYIYIYINGTFAVFIFCTPALLSGLLARAVTSRYKFRPASSGEREKNLLVRSDRETDRNAGRIGF